MFLVGSRALEFIINPKDWDFVCSIDEPLDYEKLKNIPKDSHIDIFRRVYPIQITKDNFLGLPSWDKRINKYSPIILDFDKNLLINYLLKILEDKDLEPKKLYRVEIIIIFLENNNAFNPSKQEKDLINRLHDCSLKTQEELDNYIETAKNRLLNLLNKIK